LLPRLLKIPETDIEIPRCGIDARSDGIAEDDIPKEHWGEARMLPFEEVIGCSRFAAFV
jgi:hypothetical protein